MSTQNTAEVGLEPGPLWWAQVPAPHSSSAEPPTARGRCQGSRQAPGGQGFQPTSPDFSLEAEAPPGWELAFSKVTSPRHHPIVSCSSALAHIKTRCGCRILWKDTAPARHTTW